jgi:hypothetical protein
MAAWLRRLRSVRGLLLLVATAAGCCWVVVRVPGLAVISVVIGVLACGIGGLVGLFGASRRAQIAIALLSIPVLFGVEILTSGCGYGEALTTIEGTVVDEDTGRPVRGAGVLAVLRFDIERPPELEESHESFLSRVVAGSPERLFGSTDTGGEFRLVVSLPRSRPTSPISSVVAHLLEGDRPSTGLYALVVKANGYQSRVVLLSEGRWSAASRDLTGRFLYRVNPIRVKPS